MTVRELIEVLQLCPSGAIVVRPNDDVGNHEATYEVGYGVCEVEQVEDEKLGCGDVVILK